MTILVLLWLTDWARAEYNVVRIPTIPDLLVQYVVICSLCMDIVNKSDTDLQSHKHWDCS